MREHELEKTLTEAMEKTKVGEDLNISFKGVDFVIGVTITVEGGWVFNHTIPPGGNLRLTKGAGEIDINMAILNRTSLN